MNTKHKFIFYSDPGHGWLKVEKRLLEDLKIETTISPYSYERNEFAYLEEDCDAPRFIDAYTLKFGVKPTFKERHTNKSSKIRSYKNIRFGQNPRWRIITDFI